MEVGRLVELVTENWGTITTVGLAVGGSYAVKVQLAIKSIQATIKEAEDVLVANQKALEDGTVDTAEAKIIAKEIQEFVVSLHEALKNVTSIIPKKYQAKIPIKIS